MYEQFFGLREKPFSLTPDTDYCYRYSGHQEALNVLLVALRNGEGFVRISGEVGTGKTLLCRQILKLLQNDYSTAYLPNPLLTPHELYQAIASELQLPATATDTVQQLQQRLLEALIRLRETNRPLVVLIDEAQAMPHATLEALRLLSNLETEKEKLLHIFFFAQPEFEERLAQPDLRQLRQRISYSYQLPTLQQKDLAGYLEHRLKIAGHHSGKLFQLAAIERLHAASRGIPRLINLLAHKSLLAAYGKGLQQIDRAMVGRAIDDTWSEKVSPRSTVLTIFTVNLLTVLAAAVLTLLLLKVLR